MRKWKEWDAPRRLSAVESYMSGNSVKAIAKAHSTSKRYVKKILSQEGVKLRSQSEAQTGKHNGFWKGGKKICGGYVHLRRPDHPLATKSGYVSEHRLVVEKMIGRYLLRSEVIHHIDGNRKNNSPDNLQVFSSNAEHLAHELKGRKPRWTKKGVEKIRRGIKKSIKTRQAKAWLRKQCS